MSTNTIAPSKFLPPHRQRFSRLARFIFFRLLDTQRMNDEVSLRVVEDWGKSSKEYVLGHGPLMADIEVHDRAAYGAIVFGGTRGMGRSFVNGLWDTSDMTAVVRALFRASQPLRHRQDAGTRQRLMWLGVVPTGVRLAIGRWIRRSQAKVTDRKNIHAHYDLSNEFFQLMLDETMAYSCAIFDKDTTTLYDAQVEKFDRICRKLNLGPNDHVIEIGTGWGGFAMHAARHYGARVTTTTISENQRVAATDRVAKAGLSDLVTVIGEHYDDLEGTYDALVSLEMIEAVNWRQYDKYFKKCSSLLSSKGRMAIQAITIVDQSFERAKLQKDFIRDLIFPGGCLPSIAAIMHSVSNATDLVIRDLDDIGVHYATTLQRWRANVDERFEEIRGLGFDTRFKRLWDMYLQYCEAAFLERHISDVQLLFHKPDVVTPLGFRVS
jgi:cyclopropane-fatty-acyl-phospholipid synthase